MGAFQNLSSSVTGIDLYAGGGGTTEGAVSAGVEMLWASNHKQITVDTHSLNHPEAVHVCQDLQLADWNAVPSHDIIFASPCCQGHSHAAGKARRSKKADKSRATAWAVVDCLDIHRSPVGVIENTAGFLDWDLYPAWEFALKSMGYSIGLHVLNLVDTGKSQSRERVYFVITKSKNAIELNIEKRERGSARDIVDLNFENYKWDLVSSKCAKTQMRVRNGRAQYGDVFMDASYGSAISGRSIDAPLGTVMTVNKHYLVMGEYIRPLSIPELADAQTFRSDYIWPESKTMAKEMIGNANPPYMAEMITKALIKQF